MTAVRFAPLFALVFGCSQAQPDAPAPAVDLSKVQLVPDAPGVPASVLPQPPVQPPPPPKPPEPPPEFKFAADLGGKAVARAVAPNITKPLALDRAPAAPKPRAVPERVLNPDAVARADFAPPPLLPPKPPAAKPANPAERVPLDLGARADAPPAKPVLPVAAVETPRARDANLPPPPPVLGRQYTERASLDDPTTETGNSAATANTVPVALAQSPFLKLGIPDPFELLEQVKPKVPAANEPSALPVPVNPPRRN
jgi:hypothetical protein